MVVERRTPSPLRPMEPAPMHNWGGKTRLALPNTYPQGRQCVVCAVPLSRYNADTRCWVHQIRKRPHAGRRT